MTAKRKSSRRSALLSLAGLATVLTRPSSAMSRPPAHGRLQLSLPISNAQIDPHDPHDLSAALLSSCLFETLYQRQPSGQFYPTLAASLPEKDAHVWTLALRPGLMTAQGQHLNASMVASSLDRANSAHRHLSSLSVTAEGDELIKLRTELSFDALMHRLTSPLSAIVPPGFNPKKPQATGALAVSGPGISRLTRNGWAPRGGSFFDGVDFKTRDLRSCLRDFEQRRSHVALLGRGLYRSGQPTSKLSLGTVGTLVLLAGNGLSRFAAPGVLSDILSRTSSPGLSALGVSAVQTRNATTYRGPALQLEVDRTQPWLVAIAEELARTWTSPGSQLSPARRTPSELSMSRRTGLFDAQLLFIRRQPQAALAAHLYSLDGTLPPRNSSLTGLDQISGRLRLGVVGTLQGWGSQATDVSTLSSEGAFAVENAFFTPAFD